MVSQGGFSISIFIPFVAIAGILLVGISTIGAESRPKMALRLVGFLLIVASSLGPQSIWAKIPYLAVGAASFLTALWIRRRHNAGR